MSFDLIAHLNLNSTRHLAIVSEASLDVSFVLPWMIHAGVRRLQRPTLVLSTSQIFSHYARTVHKLGANVGALPLSQLASDKFMFIDGFSRFYEESTNERKFEQTAPQIIHLFTHSSLPNTLLSLVSDYIDQHADALIILDDMMPFIYSGCHYRELALLIRQLCNLASSNDRKATIVSLTQVNLGISVADELSCQVTSSAQLILYYHGLTTGYSRDVDGCAIVEKGKAAYPNLILSKNVLVEPIELQYKVLDNEIRFFGRGIGK